MLIANYCRGKGYPIPIEEHVFHEAGILFEKKRLWRFDLCFIDGFENSTKTAIELHGGVWTKGRHTTGSGMTADREKVCTAICMGWRVIEVTTQQVDNGFLFRVLDHLFGSK